MISSTVITLLIGVAIGIAIKWLHDWNKKRQMLNTLSACVEPPAYTTIGQMVDAEFQSRLEREAAAEFGPKPTTYTRKRDGVRP